MRCLGTALLVCSILPLNATAVEKATALSAEEQHLLDKWIVRAVKLDGKPTPAQIGQKVGDIITVKRKDHRFFLS